MARIVGYIASSLDGLHRRPGRVAHLATQRTDMELGEFDYNLFIKRIRDRGHWARHLMTGWCVRHPMALRRATRHRPLHAPLPDPIGQLETAPTSTR